MSKFLFIRNDDVWALDKSFQEFFDFMFKQKIPVVYGVIPAKLQEDTALFLRRAKQEAPNLLDIVQHGYTHRNYAAPGEHQYEFGPVRTYAQQFEDISQGMQIMRRWFGELVTPGFISPYHAYDANTIDAIEALNIPLHSARLKVPHRGKKFIDLPAQIWANKADEQGIPWPLDFHGLSRDLASVLESGPITGMVFRHHLMVNPKDKDVLVALMRLLVQERDKGKIRTVLFSDLLNVAGGEEKMTHKADLFSYVPPKAVRLSACSACQLSCPACEPHTLPEKKNGVLGWGYLRAKDFAAFIRSNPAIKMIELSHSGEIFLNPELGIIIKDAFEQGVVLTAMTGVNLNKVSEQVCEDLVKYQFRAIKVAIDGADPQTYAQYRQGGNFTDVINNVKRINLYKEKYNSLLPRLQWQFIPFSHNEHQILEAKKMARELKMSFKVKLNARADYAPVKNKELIRQMTASGSATREEHQKQYATSVGLSCHELWTSPQINWNGMMTGCCANYFLNVGNVFEDGLETVMRSERYIEMKKAVLGISTPGSDVPCRQCPIYLSEVPAEVRIRSTLKSLVTGRTHG